MIDEPLAYLNGKRLPYSQATLSLHDAGWVFGATVTDFCRTFHRRLFRWSDHLSRFRRDCAACSIPLLQTDAELTAMAQELVEYNARLAGPDSELALISFATPGEIPYFVGELGGAGDRPSTVGMHTLILDRPRYRRFFESGVDLFAVAHGDPAKDRLPVPGIKHRSRLTWWLADRLVKSTALALPGSIPILTAPEGQLLDTAIGHFLLVQDGVVCCPPRNQILDGISLQVVQELCGSLKIPFVETNLTRQACTTATEAMLTGSAFCLAGVRSLRDGLGWMREFPLGGPVVTALGNAWSNLVGTDIRADFLRIS